MSNSVAASEAALVEIEDEDVPQGSLSLGDEDANSENDNSATNSESESGNSPATSESGSGNEDVVSGSEVGTEENEELTEIEDEDVPLGVLDEEELTEIEDEDVPLAGGVDMKGNGDGIAVKPWYWWILALIAAVTGKTVYDKKKKSMEAKKAEAAMTEEVTEDKEK